MSTVYVPTARVSLDAVREKLPSSIFVLEGQKPAGYMVPCVCLTDGGNFIWAFEHEPRAVRFERFGSNHVYHILRQLEDALGVSILDEHGLPLEQNE